MGVTINYYIRHKKISKSKELLQNGATVTEACFQSGFNNTSYFIKAFREIVGVTLRNININKVAR